MTNVKALFKSTILSTFLFIGVISGSLAEEENYSPL